MLTLCVIGAYLLLSLLLTPMQYSYIKELKEMRKKNEEKGISQSEMYDNMSFEEQQLNYNAQGPLFLGANLIATLIYHHKHKNKKQKIENHK